MKQKMIGLFLVLAMVVTVLPTSAAAAQPAPLAISQEGLDLIKQFEGFTAMPIADGSQWSIGYGSACDPADYPYGITEEEAEVLLLEAVELYEEQLNGFLETYGVQLEQYQFDALVSITYNLGPSWLSASYRFWDMVIEGLEAYSDNEIASAIGIWCHVGTAINTSILQRRITEIRLFLYGDYAGTASPDFTYLIFDPNGGQVEHDVMLYQELGPYDVLPQVSRTGYHFSGWYTRDGRPIQEGDTAQESLTVYARWEEAGDTEDETPEVPADPPGEGEVAGAFSDVVPTDWYFESVTDLTEAGLLSGYSDGTYRPLDDVTAGQALKVILLAAGFLEQEPVNSHWASGYQTLALQSQMLDDGDVADLDAPITRQVVAKLACNAMALERSTAASVFSDTDDGYVMALYEAGILEGSLDAQGRRMFYPDDTLNRAEFARMVWSMVNR